MSAPDCQTCHSLDSCIRESADGCTQYVPPPEDGRRSFRARRMGVPRRPKLTRDDMARALTKRDEDHETEMATLKDRWTTACVENERLTRRVAELEDASEYSPPEQPADGITPQERAALKGASGERFAFTESSQNVRLWTGHCIKTLHTPDDATAFATQLNDAFDGLYVKRLAGMGIEMANCCEDGDDD